jgi:hypothetical protein
MAELAKIHTDRLVELKKSVEEAQEYFRENVDRYEKFIRFVFKTSLGDDEAATLASTGKPTIEFNILEAYISRLRGEFAKQEPNLTVRAADGVPISMLTREFTETLSVVESHLKAIFFDGANDMLDYNVYSDLLAGGFSVLRVFTEYVNEKSFEQNIMVERVFDPTLTVFDPIARKSHKGDGRFCGELFPMTRDRFEDEYGKKAAAEMKFTRNLSGFDWSYQNDAEEIVLVCDYYEKKNRRETIYKLSNGHSVTRKEYEKLLQEWEEEGNIEQPPIVLNERKTLLEYICRYRFCGSQVLDYVETDYKYLPLVFVDGNSVILKDGGSYTQMTRPYVYHAEGIQRLKNFAGQSLANELENTVQHKFVVAIESVPEDYLRPYQNVQKADVLMYQHFLDTNNPNVTLPPPREVNRTPIPPQITDTFRMSDEMTQTILGSYDSAQGVNQAQLSGIAFARSAIQSNNASMPYVVGYIKGLNRVAQIIVDLIPKYYRTPRSLPILKTDGKRSYMVINKKGSLYMNFDPNSLQVKVEAGVNFQMQKEIALQTVIAMTQANQGFAQFFNEEGLPIILDNIDIRGVDELKEKAAVWMQKQKQQQQGQMQMQQQAAQMEAQKQQMEMAAMQKQIQSPTEAEVGVMLVQSKAQNDAANTAIKARDSETKFLEIMSKIQSADVQNELKAAEVYAENERMALDSVLKLSDNISNSLKGRTEDDD